MFLKIIVILKEVKIIETNNVINAPKQSSTFEYDFIDAVTEYQITSEGGAYGKNDLLTLTESKSFDISYKVTPKAGSKAIVGEKLSTKTYTKKAKVTLVASSKNSLNGNEIVYKKSLNYNPSDGSYDLSLNVSASIFSFEPKTDGVTTSYNYAYVDGKANTGSFTVTEDGYYYVQLWGGIGGRGGNSVLGDQGGNGGAPGYLGEIIFLHNGDRVDYTVGNNGVNGANGRALVKGQGGEPGIGSYIKVNNKAVLAAGGSGGGGGALWTGPPGRGWIRVSEPI